MRTCAIAVAFAVLAAAACRRHQVPSREVHLQVELDAFSGRPNPRWELSSEQSADFAARFRSLKPANAAAAAGEGLGYRGFVVRSLDGYDEVRIFRGTVTALRSGKTELLSDPDGALERWLLDSARDHVDEPVLNYIRTEIGR